MVMKLTLPREVEWDYGDATKENPVIENDLKFLNTLFNPSSYLSPKAKATVSDARSTSSTRSGSTSTSKSEASLLMPVQNSMRGRDEAEELAEKCMQLCSADEMTDLEEVNSVVTDRVDPDYMALGFCNCREMIPDINTIMDSKTVEHISKSIALKSKVFKITNENGDSMVGKSVDIHHKSLFDDASFDTHDEPVLHGQGAHEDFVLMSSTKKVFSDAFTGVKRHIFGDDVSAGKECQIKELSEPDRRTVLTQDESTVIQSDRSVEIDETGEDTKLESNQTGEDTKCGNAEISPISSVSSDDVIFDVLHGLSEKSGEGKKCDHCNEMLIDNKGGVEDCARGTCHATTVKDVNTRERINEDSQGENQEKGQHETRKALSGTRRSSRRFNQKLLKGEKKEWHSKQKGKKIGILQRMLLSVRKCSKGYAKAVVDKAFRG